MSGRYRFWASLAAFMLLASALAGLAVFAAGPSHSGHSGLRADTCTPTLSASNTAVASGGGESSFTVSVATTTGDSVGVAFFDAGGQTISGVHDSESSPTFVWLGSETETFVGHQNISAWGSVAASTTTDTLTVTLSGTTDYWGAVAFDVTCGVFVNAQGGDATTGTTLTESLTAGAATDLFLNFLAENERTPATPTIINSETWPKVFALGGTDGCGNVCGYTQMDYGTTGTTSPVSYTDTDTTDFYYFMMDFAIEFATPGGPTLPPAPTGINAVAQSTTSILVSWTQATGGGITSNTVYLWLATSCTGPATSSLILSPATSYLETSLTPNRAYGFEVAASNLTGIGTPSACAEEPTFPPAPSGLVATPHSADIQLTWTNPSDPESILYQNNITAWTGSTCTGTPLGVQLIVPAGGYDWSGLSPLTTYSFNVNVLNDGHQLNGVPFYASVNSTCVTSETSAGTFAIVPIVLGPTGIVSDWPQAGFPTHAWENVTAGVAPYSFVWTLVYNETNLSNVPSADMATITGQAAESGEVNITFNFVGNFTLTVTVTDSRDYSGATWQVYDYQTLFGTPTHPNPFPIYAPQSLSFRLLGEGVKVTDSNASYGNDTVTIAPLVSGTEFINDYCAAYQDGSGSGQDFSAGWKFNGTSYGLNQTGCDRSGAPRMVAETFTLPAGVYHITAWVVDAWTDVNYTFAWTFTIYNATGSGGGGGPPLGGIPFGWVVALIIAAVAVGVLMGLGSRRRSNSWGWD